MEPRPVQLIRRCKRRSMVERVRSHAAPPAATKECGRERIEESTVNIVGVALLGGDWVELVKGTGQVELLGDEQHEAQPDVAVSVPASAPEAESPKTDPLSTQE